MRQPTNRGGAIVKNVAPYRIIYGDTDQMGVAYYANYLRWFEVGRSELLRAIGLPYGTIEAQGFHFPVTEVNCRYAQSARYDDLIEIATEISSMGRATFVCGYNIRRAPDGAHLASGSTKHACVDRNGRIVRIPEILLEALKKATTKADR
ncbi:MAG TPA: thioesterase family protein [Candidatus Binatia bacterium]|jgi:acyl-CoA thioester hydrolase